MSRINDLIQKFCPKGVDIVNLSEISFRLYEKNQKFKYETVRAVTSNGELIDPLLIFKDSVASEDKSNYLVVRKNNYMYNPSRINIGSIAYSREDNPVIISPMYIVFDLDKSKISNEYFNYFIRSFEGKRQILSNVEEGARFRFPYESLEKLVIPLPPLTVQSEIVRVLDNFSEHISELTTELTVRKLQYDYYKNQLLLNAISKNAKWESLENVCESIFSGKNTERNEDGEYPIYGSTGIIAYSDTYRFDEELLLIARVGVNAGYVNIVKGKFDVSDNTLIIRPKPGYNIRFVYYQLQNLKINYLAVGGGQPLITVSKLKKINFLLPPHNEQQRIVEILDKFDKLVNDISEGLPAEIAARKKQYEYYRDKLLTFKEVGNESI